MKSILLFAPWTLLALAAPTGAQQVTHSYYHYSGAGATMAAFQDRPLLLLHTVIPDTLKPGTFLTRQDPIGHTVPHPVRPTGDLLALLDAATASYDTGGYAAAVDLVEEYTMAEAPNPFILDIYARALFRIDARRDESRTAYRRLMEILDNQLVPDPPDAVPIDPYFGDAYGKLAALYLDIGDYEAGAYESTRALVTATIFRGGWQSEFADLQMSHLTEAFTEMGLPDVARELGRTVLLLNPGNQYVIPYLRRIGPGSDSVVACTQPEPSRPPRGPYSFSRLSMTDTTLTCTAGDGEDGIAPCLRIGRIHIGETAVNILNTLGPPRQVQPANPPAYVYLVHYDARADRGTYFAIQYEKVNEEPIAMVIQLTGGESLVTNSMSCLELGALEEDVRQQLGEPSQVSDVFVQTLGDSVQYWSYEPVPLSVEIHQGRLYSVRLWRPDHLPPMKREYPYTLRVDSIELEAARRDKQR